MNLTEADMDVLAELARRRSVKQAVCLTTVLNDALQATRSIAPRNHVSGGRTLHISISLEQRAWLDRTAAERRVSTGRLIRELIDAARF